MSLKGRRFLLGVFSDESKMVQSAEELREHKISIFDIYTPFPVHGLDELLGIKRSRLPIVCFIAGAIGVAFAIWFQIWSSASDWPLNVGGKPFNSFPAFVPVAFEITVLFGALITVAAFFFRSRLFPGAEALIPHHKVTDNAFVLVLEEVDAGLDTQLIMSILEKNGADEVLTKGEKNGVDKKLYFTGGAFPFGLTSCSRKPEETGIEILPDMVHSVAYEAYSESQITADGKSMMEAPQNSIARNFMPFSYGKGEQESIRAGIELKNPLTMTEKVLLRGKHVYDNYCLVCHGEKGKGDGPLIPKFPNPPSLTSKRLVKYEDGRIFHVITKGFGDMPGHAAQILPKDRWALVYYVKKLQGRN